MQSKLRYVAIILSILVLAAHFYRIDNLPLMAVILASPLLLVIRKQWSVGVFQILLMLGGIEWVRTAMLLAMQREALGLPWARMALILGGVASFTFWTAYLSRRREQK